VALEKKKRKGIFVGGEKKRRKSGTSKEREGGIAGQFPPYRGIACLVKKRGYILSER